MDDARDLVWLNLKSYLALGHRDIWWPGRVLHSGVVLRVVADPIGGVHARHFFVRPSPSQLQGIRVCRSIWLPEGIGLLSVMARPFLHCSILILQRSIEPIYVRGISSELFQALTDVNNGAPTTVLYSQLKRGVVILEEVALKNRCDA